jgi:ABC-type uncharacterized transport system permease subunit
LQWVIGLSAFWTTHLTAIADLYWLNNVFFSGIIALLELLPHGCAPSPT